MKNIRVDSEGEFRCWNCGNKGLIEKRTFRSKAAIGVGAMLTKKKLQCQTCGEYNDTGNAQPFTGPEARKWRKVWETAAAASAQRSQPVQEFARVGAPPAWMPDPRGRHQFRYWDGGQWTDHVSDAGAQTTDPV